MRHALCHQRGYTLIELLLTAGIAALVIQAGLGLGDLVARERQVLAVLELQRLVQFARGQAVNLQADVVLCALNQNQNQNQACEREWTGRQVVVFNDRDGDRKLDDGEALQMTLWPEQRGRLAWRASLGRPYLAFSAMGDTHQNGSFVLCREAGVQRPDVVLTLNRGGRPYLNTPGKRRCPE